MAFDLGKLVADAGKGITDFVAKTAEDLTKTLDQNGDGKLDFSDLQTMSERAKAARLEAQRKAEIDRLKPLFAEDTEKTEFALPKMIRVAEMDKAHASSEVCRNSIGFTTVSNDMNVITIYRNHVDSFGLSFYPEKENSVFYVDPCDRDHYISLDDYFSYMKMCRVAELQRIAQALGAKHFRITYKERKKKITSNTVDASVDVKVPVSAVKVAADYEHSVNSSSMSAVSIEAEMEFPGHLPVTPELHYLKNEINIRNLISLRMDPSSPLQHQRFNIEMSNSSGIRAKDAAKIDAVLKEMKISGTTTVTSEVQAEARRILEYEIDF